MSSTTHSLAQPPDWPAVARPVEIRLLGEFDVLKLGRSADIPGDTKAASLLGALALRGASGVSRDALLELLWPRTDPGLAGGSLHSLVYSLHKSLGDALGAPPVIRHGGTLRLNWQAGLGVDVATFDALIDAGDRAARAGDRAAAAGSYRRAAGLYRGDLCPSAGTDVRVVIERERLRARYLTLLARLADDAEARGEYAEALAHALALLSAEPGREDAHRLAMRCYLRRGERAQALRQYLLCERLLRSEFEAVPEPATRALFDRIRLDPGGI